VNTTATIQYYLPEDTQVILEIYNSTGQKIMQPANGNLSKGEHFVPVNAGDLPAGFYYYSMRSGKCSATGKIIVLK
jgi:hypothetical protein